MFIEAAGGGGGRAGCSAAANSWHSDGGCQKRGIFPLILSCLVPLSVSQSYRNPRRLCRAGIFHQGCKTWWLVRCPLFPRSVKHLVHALPGSHRMFPCHPSLSLDESATSSGCGLDTEDFHSATGSPRLFPYVLFLLLLLFQQCLRAVTVLACMISWETLVLALPSNFHQARELPPSVFPGFLVPFLLLPNCDCPSATSSVLSAQVLRTFPFHKALNQNL